MLDGIATSPRPFVLLTGAAGTGKTTLLARLSDRSRRMGHRVAAVRCTSRGDLVPVRFEQGDDEPLVRLPAREEADGWGPFGPVPGARDDPDLARRVATGIAVGLAGSRTVLIVDDAQWLDPDSLAVLHALVRTLAGGTTRCVCAVRTPVPAPAAARMAAMVRDLRAADLVTPVRVAPRGPRAVAREVTGMLAATPEPALTRRVRELSRGLPALVRDTVEALRRNGSIQVVDRTPYLVRPHTPLDPHERLADAVRDLGEECWAAAKALAVLAPLGAPAPRLLAEALRVPEPAALEPLHRLREAGVVHRGGPGRRWRFVVPLVGAAVFAGLGPFERRQLSAAVVTAVWADDVVCDDQDYLADRIADAGALVDPERALRELVARAAAVGEDRPESALRWLTAAADLTRDRRERVRVLLMRTVTCAALGDSDQCLSGAQSLLDDYADELTPDTAQEVAALATAALGGVGDADTLRELATRQRRWAGGAEQSIVTQALACGQLDRWQPAGDLLSAAESEWRSGNPVSAMLADLTWTMARLWTGSPDRFERGLAARADWPLRGERRHLLTQVESHVTALLVTGDRHRAERLLADEGMTAEELPPHCRSMLAAARGEAELAVDLARRAIACGANRSAGMVASTVSVLVARGELATARQLLDAARATNPPLAHLLDIADAQVDRAFGDEDGAAERLRHCAASAAERGLRVGTDLLWSELVDLALTRGDRAEAEQGVAELARLDEEMPSTRTTMLALLARATVEKDHEAAHECHRLAAERGQPLEQAIVLERLVAHGQSEPRLLGEAYGLLGALDAVLYRAWLRNLMREHGVPVPGRKETVAENERLLAMLAAGGLSNKQLAAALRTSDKSVEGRLSRLFSRTGYRSRIELSTAMLNGEYRSA